MITVVSLLVVCVSGMKGEAAAQERVKIAYSSADASNFVWYASADTGFYRGERLNSTSDLPPISDL